EPVRVVARGAVVEAAHMGIAPRVGLARILVAAMGGGPHETGGGGAVVDVDERKLRRDRVFALSGHCIVQVARGLPTLVADHADSGHTQVGGHRTAGKGHLPQIRRREAMAGGAVDGGPDESRVVDDARSGPVAAEEVAQAGAGVTPGAGRRDGAILVPVAERFRGRVGVRRVQPGLHDPRQGAGLLPFGIEQGGQGQACCHDGRPDRSGEHDATSHSLVGRPSRAHSATGPATRPDADQGGAGARVENVRMTPARGETGREPSAAEKVAAVAEMLRDSTGAPAEVRETSMAWVFLTPALAYKMKKPIRRNSIDFTSLDLRHDACAGEVRLNRRLAADVYLGLSRLARDRDGTLALD